MISSPVASLVGLPSSVLFGLDEPLSVIILQAFCYWAFQCLKEQITLKSSLLKGVGCMHQDRFLPLRVSAHIRMAFNVADFAKRAEIRREV